MTVRVTRGIGVAVLLLGLGCDADSGRASAPFTPSGDKADEPISAIEAFDFDAVARDLVNQADEPFTDGAGETPPSEPEDDTGGDAPDTGGDEPDTGGDEPDTGGDAPDTGGDPPACAGFECADGSCIEASWECDGFDDCTAAEDEANCEESCSGHTCGDGTCIQGDWVCDEIADCVDGSDEAACGVGVGVAQQGFDLAGQRGPQNLDVSCVFTSTGTGALAGVAAAEIASKSCVAGGVVVGVASAPTGAGAAGGFGVAVVCGAADVTQVDAIAGGVLGAVGGLVGGVALCDGGIVDQANNFLNWVWGNEPETIPVYHMQSSGTGTGAVPGLGSSSLTCTPAPSNRETGYNDEKGCGKNQSFDHVCHGSGTCEEWQALANRNLICHWGRIISANSFQGGAPNEGHLKPIRATRTNFEDCKRLIEDNCGDEHDPMSEEDAQADGAALVCG